MWVNIQPLWVLLAEGQLSKTARNKILVEVNLFLPSQRTRLSVVQFSAPKKANLSLNIQRLVINLLRRRAEITKGSLGIFHEEGTKLKGARKTFSLHK